MGTTQDTSLVITKALGDALERIDRYISDTNTLLRVHGNSPCSTEGWCNCVADARADLRRLNKAKNGLTAAMPYIW